MLNVYFQKIQCHRQLSGCIETAAIEETSVRNILGGTLKPAEISSLVSQTHLYDHAIRFNGIANT